MNLLPLSPAGAKKAVVALGRNPVKALLIGLIRVYQAVVSPALPGRCKYYPSCSQYALDAVREHGAARGSVLAAWRLLRCNPLSYGGFDPVSRQKLFHRHATGLHEETPAHHPPARGGADLGDAGRSNLVRG